MGVNGNKWRSLAIAFVAVTALLISCGEKDGDKGDEVVKEAAEEYFGYLKDSNYVAYTNGLEQAENMDSAELMEMQDLVHQYMHQMNVEHNGVVSAHATRDTIMDTIARVFVDVQFGDSTHEQISLPMVYTRGKWWMK